MEMRYDEPVRQEHVVLSFENGEVVYPDNLDFYDISGDDPWVDVLSLIHI